MAGDPSQAYVYSLGQRCATEGLGMMMTVYLGEGILANELLAKTKGHEMGWLWVALGWGMAFGIPITLFNFASAKLNPAMLLANWAYLGTLGAGEFFALAAAECLGGFVGACLVWLHYLPHFKTIPEPPPASSRAGLLRPRDYVGIGGLRIAGYNTARHGERPRARIRDFLSDARGYLDQDYLQPVEEQVMRECELQHPGGGLRRRSIQVADLHRRLETVDVAGIVGGARQDDKVQRSASTGNMAPSSAGSLEGSASGGTGAAPPPPAAAAAAGDGSSKQHVGWWDQISRRVLPGDDAGDGAATSNGRRRNHHHLSKEQRRERKLRKRTRGLPADAASLYRSALIADQNAKLSIFATRPAIFSPAFNFLTEFLAASALIAGALWIDERGFMLHESARGLWPTLNGLYIGLFVFVFVLAFGGPTGVGVNIARDTAPRVAHWILPIPNKGPSEWYYGWIPAVASLLGGLAGGGIFALFNKLNKSNVEALGAPFIAL